MNLCTVLGPWSAGNQPQIALDYFGALTRCDDRTAQLPLEVPPTNNLYKIEVGCDDATLILIEADSLYFVLTDYDEDTLIGDKDPDGVPSVPEYNTLKTYLSNLGFSGGWISTALGASVGGRKRSKIYETLTKELGKLTKV